MYDQGSPFYEHWLYQYDQNTHSVSNFVIIKYFWIIRKVMVNCRMDPNQIYILSLDPRQIRRILDKRRVGIKSRFLSSFLFTYPSSLFKIYEFNYNKSQE